jgi:hypothetical protein
MITTRLRRTAAVAFGASFLLAAGHAVGAGAPGTGSGVGCGSTSTISVNPCHVDFGQAPAMNYGKGYYGGAATVTIGNYQDEPLVIFSTWASWPGFFALSSCPSVLGPWESCTVNVYFAPIWPGWYGGTLTIDATWPYYTDPVRLYGMGY